MSAVTKSRNIVDEKPHYAGHRGRLRERLFVSGADALQDYELLELLLYTAIPRNLRNSGRF